MRKSLLSLLLLFLSVGIAWAQKKQVSVTGLILASENNEPIDGASVLCVEFPRSGVLTDAKGRFTLTLPEGAKHLRISYIGYLTQEASVYPDLSARQNVAYFARLAGARARGVDEVLEEVGIADISGRLVSTFSGGQRNGVSLACALVGAPELLVLDEPTVGLDPVTREDLWAAFRRIAEGGTTILVSSHVMDEAFRCDGVLLMREGRILASTTAPELLASTGAETLDDAFLTIIREAESAEKAGPASSGSAASKETNR